MRRDRMVMPLAVVLLILGGTVSAQAGSYTFNFDTLASGANAAAISTYMNGVFTAAGCTGCSVTVTGAVADQTYNGDGYTVGQKVGTSSSYTSLTLGDSNGATNDNAAINTTTPGGNTVKYDTFIANTNDSSTQISNQITMVFHGLTINGATSFDYEVFPDGTTQQPPDFIFDTNGSTNVFTRYGVTPGTTNGSATHSPKSGSGTETNQQYIGTYSGTLSNVNELDFIDWPATIGVDNLTITTTPEPGTLLLLGMGLSGLFLKRKKQIV